MLPERLSVCKEKCHLRRHDVKVGPGPPESLKVGAETPLKFKSGSPGPHINCELSYRN